MTTVTRQQFVCHVLHLDCMFPQIRMDCVHYIHVRLAPLTMTVTLPLFVRRVGPGCMSLSTRLVLVRILIAQLAGQMMTPIHRRLVYHVWPASILPSDPQAFV